MFEVAAFRQLREITRGLLGDASGEFNLYALREPPKPKLEFDFAGLLRGETPESYGDERGEALASALTGDHPPDLSSILEPGELFVDLIVGVDMGYFDVIVVHAVEEVDDRLNPLLDEYESAIALYESEVDAIETFEGFNDRLGKLVGVEP